MIYVVAPTHERFRFYCQEKALPYRSNPPRVFWVGPDRNPARGRNFEAGDQIVVLEGEWQGKAGLIQELNVIEAVSTHPPIWVWHEYYDVPRSLDMKTVERWLDA